MKRLLDISASFLGLLAFSPLLLPVMFLVWWQDRHSPFYLAPRVGKNEVMFTMVKLRSMIVNADRSGVDSTSASDQRITGVGRFIRRYKLDELTQLWNVLLGDMSLVGPRPNVKRETDLYTRDEKRLLSVKPGITDFASIVFSDEGDILKDSADPDLDYNRLIRPWKSRLGLHYVDHSSLLIDVRLILLTVNAIVSRSTALKRVSALLANTGADSNLVKIAQRNQPLQPAPPPGTKEIVSSRQVTA